MSTEARTHAAPGGTNRLPRASASIADDFLEDLLPNDLEWRQIVSDYPKSSLAVAALAGYAVGRGQGREILGAVAGFAGATLARHLNDWIGEEIL